MLNNVKYLDAHEPIYIVFIFDENSINNLFSYFWLFILTRVDSLKIFIKPTVWGSSGGVVVVV